VCDREPNKITNMFGKTVDTLGYATSKKYAIGYCDGPSPASFGSSCLQGTIPVKRRILRKEKTFLLQLTKYLSQRNQPKETG